MPGGLFTYGGSTSWATIWATIRRDVDTAIQAARPEFRLRYVNPTGEAPGSAIDIRMLMRDELAFAQSSRPVTDQEYQQASQRDMELKQVPMAIDEQIMKGRGFGATVQTVATTTQAVRKLAQTPGGIYFASAPEIVDQCTVKPIAIGRTPNGLVPPYQGSLVSPSQCPAQRNQLNEAAIRGGQYPITRSLFVVIKQNNQREQQAGEAYTDLVLSNQGQMLLEKAGFFPIR